MSLAEIISLLKSAFYIAGAAATCLGFFLILYYAYRRGRFASGSPLRASQTDLAHMMILLQTMRDLLEQQKGLARQLNEALDKKVAFIRESVESAMKELGVLRESLKSAAQQIGRAKASVAPTAEPTPGIVQGSVRPATVNRREPEAAPASKLPDGASSELQVLAHPAGAEARPDLLDNWVGLDFGGDAPDLRAFDVPEQAPEAPENADAAREAFRALLNMEEGREQKPARMRAETPSLDSGNGRTRPGSLQARVYEYHDAGMTPSQIARELGIGRGEVRLILSLRKSRR